MFLVDSAHRTVNIRPPAFVNYALKLMVVVSFLTNNIITIISWVNGFDELWLSGVFLLWLAGTLIVMELLLNVAIYVLRCAIQKFLSDEDPYVYVSEEAIHQSLLVKKSMSRLAAIQIVTTFLAIPSIASCFTLGIQRIANQGSVRVVEGGDHVIDAYDWPALFSFYLIWLLVCCGTVLTWIPMTVLTACCKRSGPPSCSARHSRKGVSVVHFHNGSDPRTLQYFISETNPKVSDTYAYVNDSLEDPLMDEADPSSHLWGQQQQDNLVFGDDWDGHATPEHARFDPAASSTVDRLQPRSVGPAGPS